MTRQHFAYSTRAPGMIAALLALTPLTATPTAAEELRIGFLNTLTGPGALLGKVQLRGFKLGLEKEGWLEDGDRLAGAPMRLFIGDDQMRPDSGLQEARKMLLSDKVDIVAGVTFSNVLMAVQRAVIRAGKIMIATNAGAAPMAGQRCSPYFIATSFNNDQLAESLGRMVNREGVKSVVAMAPNFQAGKDMIAGFRRYYKGKVGRRILFKLGQTDFQAELSRVRALKPGAVFVFAPGGMGIAFMKQWAAAGMSGKIKLYTVAVVDWLTLKPIGKAAIGTRQTIHWDSSSVRPANREFIRTYRARYASPPAFYAAQAYDAARLIAAALKKVGPNFKDRKIMARALRHTPFASVRGRIAFNVNGFPIQTWFRREVAADANGRPTILTKGTIAREMKDSYWQKCPEKNRL